MLHYKNDMLEVHGNNSQFLFQTSEFFLRQRFCEDISKLLIDEDKLNYYIIFNNMVTNKVRVHLYILYENDNQDCLSIL